MKMKVDKEIIHYSHSQHRLKFECSDALFNCDGCKEAGIGARYKCDICDFDLHKNCATPSPTLNHPFYRKCNFQFYSRPPGDKMRYCDACGQDVLGFVYHCNSCGFDLHPCCACLPPVLNDGERNLYLSLKVSAACHRCGRKGIGWSYRSECKKYNLHVSCVKDMLMESWQEIYDSGAKKINELQTRIPKLKGQVRSYHGNAKGGKVMKCCEMAGMAIKVIVSAILGDPTAIIGAVVGALISKK
ncbi:hypothetical protein AMTRI_Chr03g43490 [Amborella trichopoda]|uniref:Phorbol-ester/DAG-type domain-containing protein n=1 Tax=Amborella trichopoda TaxID=13333 RepID=W1PUB0_AMBTC|nr:uncharacterized protein LOC18439613 [Amborella trichopoda]ERN11419.1 hypothetical protein AMTR_s00022p00034890 [Amborella trichopoda]|eukprot:XP_006849838.1 uncharacterized protein LOC18439613 [Amborella trichopoda]